MSSNDFEVIAYKILAYLDSCLKSDIEPNIYKAQELTKCSEKYFYVVIASLLENGYVKGTCFKDAFGKTMSVESLNITLDGAIYLKENSTMQKVAKLLGKAFVPTLKATVTATQFL